LRSGLLEDGPLVLIVRHVVHLVLDPFLGIAEGFCTFPVTLIERASVLHVRIFAE